MRYLTMLMAVAALAVGTLVCPQSVRAQVAGAVVPDAAIAVEIDAAIESLIEQLARMSPEFRPDGRV